MDSRSIIDAGTRDDSGVLWLEGVRAFVNGEPTPEYIRYLRRRIMTLDCQKVRLEDELDALQWCLDDPARTDLTRQEIAECIIVKTEHVIVTRSLRKSYEKCLELCRLWDDDQVVSA